MQRRCLVCEDQALIAMGIEDCLEEAGVAVAGVFASSAEAFAWIEDDTPEVAILDYRLVDGLCTELATALLARGVPVVIYSGVSRGPATPRALAEVPWIEKPADRERLMRVLASLAPRKPARQPYARG